MWKDTVLGCKYNSQKGENRIEVGRLFAFKNTYLYNIFSISTLFI